LSFALEKKKKKKKSNSMGRIDTKEKSGAGPARERYFRAAPPKIGRLLQQTENLKIEYKHGEYAAPLTSHRGGQKIRPRRQDRHLPPKQPA